MSSELVLSWSVTAFEVFFYGSLPALPRDEGRRFLTVATSALFVLGTVHCALEVATSICYTRVQNDFSNLNSGHGLQVSSSLANDAKVCTSLDYASNGIYVTTTVIADSIFIFRCYAIWNFQRKIIVFPTILTIAVAGECLFPVKLRDSNTRTSLGLGYSNVVLNVPHARGVEVGIVVSVFIPSILLSLFTTLVLMGLTVGRIWWLARAAQLLQGPKVADRYRTVCAMILESGALYCAGGVVFVALSFRLGIRTTPTENGAVLAQLIGIAPTIIACRVGLGYSVESVDSFITPEPRAHPLAQFPTPAAESPVLYISADDMKPDVIV
ncbi:hypothetical protein DFH09DRAFT_1444197 [Mycena vulgaris]|nr:hypothetical protein DFH09DRAFT_1444197 [Mycena vulgaris]